MGRGVHKDILKRLAEADLRRSAEALLRDDQTGSRGAPERVRLLGRHSLPEGVAAVDLTKGYWCIIDAEDAPSVLAINWHVRIDGGRTSKPYAARSARPGETQHLHRWLIGAPKGLYVDHWNGDSLDCRRINLRPCTPCQNAYNRHIPTPGYRGVKACPSGFRAQIEHAGQRVIIGVYPDAEIAARAYDAVALELRGCFAVLNFPEVGR